MRLLNTSTLVVEDFLQEKLPEYAILSHTWDVAEVTLDDIRSGRAIEKQGYAKIKECCQMALKDGFSYCWIDTCCIDKTSSSELSESINSMYRWYAGSCICYVYLSDVTKTSDAFSPEETTEYNYLEKARWFTRGWTLQELIAPALVEFYDRDWKKIGTKGSLIPWLTNKTGIDRGVLEGIRPDLRNVALRMSWASGRETTRVEDEAYCLLGIFGVNMPLLYGEGHQAFRRLQEEILRIEEDYTLFTTHTRDADNFRPEGLLASRTSDFKISRLMIKTESAIFQPDQFSRDPFSLFTNSDNHPPPQMTGRGLHISLPLMHYEYNGYWACITLLSLKSMDSHILCRLLTKMKGDRFSTAYNKEPRVIPRHDFKNFERKLIYVQQPTTRTVIPRFCPTSEIWGSYVFILQVDSVNYSDLIGPCSALSSVRTLSKAHNNLDPTPDNGSAAKVTKVSPDEVDRLLMHKDLGDCYISNSPHLDHWFAFRLKHSNSAFIVNFVARDAPSCQIWNITSSLFKTLESDPLHKQPKFKGSKSLQGDHVFFHFPPNIRGSQFVVSASIKRIATFIGTSVKLPRYSLSIRVEYVIADRRTEIA
jgi:hypothetical protein